MRTRILIPILLIALVACSAPADSTAPASEGTAAEAVEVNLMDFMIDPSRLQATGPLVTIDVSSDGPTPHNLTVRDGAGEVVMATADLSAGGTETISAELEPGDYTILCSLAGHASLGMTGTLRVTAP
jgi:plastocyanin